MQNFSGEQPLNYWKIRLELFVVLQVSSPWFPAKTEDFKEMNPIVDYMYLKIITNIPSIKLFFHKWTGKSEGKVEEPVDWSFAVLELLREQGWDVKEMNERYSFYFILAFE